MFSCVYKAQGQEQTTPWWQSFDVNRKPRSRWPFVASFKMISLNSDFIHIFLIILDMYIALGQGQTNPWGQNFDVNRKLLPLQLFVASLKKSLWINIPILYTFFNVFPHIYSPGAGADNPLWTKFWCQQKGFVTLPICCKFKKNIFEVWFYTYFCLFLYMYIAPGQGQTTPWCQNFYFNVNLLSLWSFSSIKWLSNSFSPYKSIRDQIWPCYEIGQGQPRVIIWTKHDGPESPMLHTKPQGHWPLVLEKKIFEGFLPHMWPRPRE